MHKTKHQAVDYTPVLKEYIPKMVVLYERFGAKYPHGTSLETPTSVHNPNGERVRLRIHTDGVSLITECDSYGIMLKVGDKKVLDYDYNSRISKKFMFITPMSETCVLDIGDWSSIGFVMAGEGYYTPERQYSDFDSCYFQESLLHDCYDYDTVLKQVQTVKELHAVVVGTQYEIDVSSTNLSTEKLLKAMKMVDKLLE